MHISSPAFRAHGDIPARFTCEGQDVSPPLSFDVGDIGARSLALVVDDPDAPRGNFVHWVLYNIPASTMSIAEGAVPEGALQGKNDFGRKGYGGPCPPGGRKHRYVFTLYALDVELPDLRGPSRDELVAAMTGHILGQAQLVGTYAMQGAEAHR